MEDWDSAWQHYRELKAAYEAYQRDNEAQDQRGDQSQVDDAEAVLIGIPAPDPGALRWKLDRLLTSEPDGDVLNWTGSYIAQTIADYRRLLAHEPEQPKPRTGQRTSRLPQGVG